MTRAYQRRLILGLVVVTLGIASLLTTTFLVQLVSADDPGKPRGRNALEPRASLNAQEQAQVFKLGRPWDGIGRGGMSQGQVSDFGDYPLFWLGEVFAGFNLQAARHVKYTAPAGAKSQDRVTFIYG